MDRGLMELYSSLKRLVRKAKQVLILGHRNSDPDAVCSAYALSDLLKQLNRRCAPIFTSPEGISKLSEQILSSVPLRVEEKPDPSQADLIITVDTNSLEQLGAFMEPVLNSKKPLVMIDHHAPNPENSKLAELVVCDDSFTSTCELIIDIYQKMKLRIPATVSQALLIGILVETGHLNIATRRTYEYVCALIGLGADPETALSTIQVYMDPSERTARLKAAQRTRIETLGGWLIALSEVGSYQASAARALVALGADLAVVAGERDHELSISLRSSKGFASKTGINLGSDLARLLGESMNGTGGGHMTAAGANVKGTVKEAHQATLRILRQTLNQHAKDPQALSSKTKGT